jgi:hypothetical protein
MYKAPMTEPIKMTKMIVFEGSEATVQLSYSISSHTVCNKNVNCTELNDF